MRINRAYWVVKIEKNWHATFSTFACDRLKPRVLVSRVKRVLSGNAVLFAIVNWIIIKTKIV